MNEVYDKSKIKIYETQVSKIWRDEHGVVHGVFLPRTEQVLAHAVENVGVFAEIGGREKILLLMDLTNLKSADREARQYIAGPEGQAAIGVLALLVPSLFTRTIGNLFLKIDKPPYPMHMFTDKTKATEWLLQYDVEE